MPIEAALEDIRVIEIGDDKGSYCGKLFADMGAEVLKLEPPEGAGDRGLPPCWQTPDGSQQSFSFLYSNTSKKSLTLDLRCPEGQANARRLIAGSELVIDSLAPGTLARWGLSPGQMLADNPGLVVTSISDFGQWGPHSHFESADIVTSAMSGVMVATGFPDDPPVKLVGEQTRIMASTMAAASSLIALYHSRRTGQGQHVDISSQETMLAVGSICGVGKWLEDGVISKRFGTGLFASVPSGAYPCVDGSVYIMVNRPRHWQALARWVNEVTGNQEVLDPMFDGPSSARQPYRELLDIFIQELTLQYSVDDFYREGQHRHLAVTPLNTARGICQDAHLRARDFFVSVRQRSGELLQYPGAPYRLSQTPWQIRSPAPAAGQHNHQLNQLLARQKSAYFDAVPEMSHSEDATNGHSVAARREQGALSGLRVVEFTAGMAGPWIGRLMAFCGADVIKVESRNYPDVTRLYVPPQAPEMGVQPQLSPWLTDWNAGKRCVCLDLSRPEAGELARQLISTSDVVIDNNSNGVLEKLGLGFAELERIDPRLVLLSSTGYGDFGPDASYISWGPNLEALSGLSALSGFPWRDCTMTQFAYPDPLSALYGLFAIMSALHYRDRSDQGQRINVSQLEATVASMGDVLMPVLACDREPRKLGNRSLFRAPQGVYRCRDSGDDDCWCVISVSDENSWHNLCHVLQHPEWVDDVRFVTLSDRLGRHDELDVLLESATREWDAQELMQALQARGVAAGVTQTVHDQWYSDEHLKVRGFFEVIRHEKKGTVTAPGIPLGLQGTPGRTRHAGRAIGQDNEDIFCGLLGLSRENYNQLVASKVIQ